MLPKKTRDFQNNQMRPDPESTVKEKTVFIYIELNNSAILIPIIQVKEVSEILPIRPYPISVEGHIGIVNLRGNIIPVFSISWLLNREQFDDFHKEIAGANRLVILSKENGTVFSIIAKSIDKVALDKTEQAKGTVKVFDRVVKITSVSDLFLEDREHLNGPDQS